jgi:mercuric ion binding protein
MRNLLLLLTLVLPITAIAGEQTVTLSVPDMNCGVCPITVSKALKQVEGVIEAMTDITTKTAVVIYDDQVADVELLTQATTDAGYPSTALSPDA